MLGRYNYFILLGSLVADDFAVGGSASFGDLTGVDWYHSLCTCRHSVAHYVHEASKFIGSAEDPFTFGERVGDKVFVLQAEAGGRINAALAWYMMTSWSKIC